MRLQEVLKEREAEISTLEQSLKDRPAKPLPAARGISAISELDDAENELDEAKVKELSPKTLKQFKDLRRLSRRLSLQNPGEPTGDPVVDPSETLDRLNELMLYVKAIAALILIWFSDAMAIDQWHKRNHTIAK